MASWYNMDWNERAEAFKKAKGVMVAGIDEAWLDGRISGHERHVTLEIVERVAESLAVQAEAFELE